MACYHLSTYLRVQGIKPNAQRRLLATAWGSMVFTKFITFPQKLLPAGFAVYWLIRMWKELEVSAWGRAWLGWCLSLLIMLLTIQVKFCDDIFPICDHMHHKLDYPDDPITQKATGPVMRFLLGRLRRRKPAAMRQEPGYGTPDLEDEKQI